MNIAPSVAAPDSTPVIAGCHLLVMAKAPVAGRVKTRLQSVLSPSQAAEVAAAALHDTLTAVAGCGSGRRIVALDGESPAWLPSQFEVVAQCGGSFQRRLGAAWAAAGGPGLQIGMDTPQVTSEMLDAALGELLSPGVDAVLGLAEDGGWWGLGLREPHPRVFDGVPMSQADTGRCQLERLTQLGLRTRLLPALRDIDLPDDLAHVAREWPELRTSGTTGAAAALALCETDRDREAS